MPLLLVFPVPRQEGQAEPPAGSTPVPVEREVAALLREKTGRDPRTHRGSRYTIHTDDPALDMAVYEGVLDRVSGRIAEVLDIDLPAGSPNFQAIHFRSGEDYEKFCKAVGLEPEAVEATGCYAPRLPGRPIVLQGADLTTLHHEAAHQIIDREIGPGIQSYPWLAEGLASLFEAYPPENFRQFRRYPKGRDAILKPGFSLETLVAATTKEEGTYDLGAAVNGLFLFSADRDGYLRWLKDLARKKCTPSDLPRYVRSTWRDLEARVRKAVSRDEGTKQKDAGK